MSDHLQLRVQGAGRLDGLQNGQQVLRRGAQLFSARTTSASWAAAGIWINLPGSCLIWMLAFCVTTVWPPVTAALGWLMTGVELMLMDRLPCAMAQGPSVTAWFSTMEPVRALMTTLAAATELPAAALPSRP
jgi:hypothetical protein